MTYSVESLLFKAAAGVVNTAARAANSLLEVMYPPRYDVAHIWDEPEQSPHEAAASADPHPADAADPAGARDTPLSPPAGSLTWFGWCYPAIVEVLATHHFRSAYTTGYHQGNHTACYCDEDPLVMDEYDWRDHVAALISERIACDPARAIAALQNLQTQQ